MKRLTFLAVSLMFSACSAAQAYTDAGAKFTTGQAGYTGVNAFAEWGNDDYYLSPSLNTYKSDLSDRYSTYALGAGLDGEAWSAGAELSVTPETGGYKNTAFYGDLTYNLLQSPAEDALLDDAGIGIFARLTAHEDAYALSTTTVSGTGRRGGSVSALTDVFKLNQTDYGASISLRIYGLRASGRFTKTIYNKDVTAEARQLPLAIGGIGTSGFPDTAVSLKLRAAGLPLSPEAGYTKTEYLMDQPASESFSLGVTVKAGPASISAGWENYNPGGGSARSSYYSAGLKWSF